LRISVLCFLYSLGVISCRSDQKLRYILGLSTKTFHALWVGLLACICLKRVKVWVQTRGMCVHAAE